MKIAGNKQISLLLAAGGLTALTGCGGGGGNGNSGTGTTTTGTTTGTTGTSTGVSSTAQVIGKVTDVAGKGVPGVSIAVDTGGQITSTISTGGYRLTNLSGEVVHKLLATATIGGVQYTGSTQVFTSSNALVSNANIIVSAASQQATVQGIVRNASGAAVAGATVYLAVPNIATGSNSGNYSSLIAFTGTDGSYLIANVPSALPTGSLLLTASGAGYANSNATVSQNSATAGSVVTQNFTLAATTSVAADVPVVVGVNAFTQPTDGLVSNALRARLSGTSGTVYEGLRRRFSPQYAASVTRRTALGSRAVARAVGGTYATEIDLGFQPPAAANVNLFGYNVYRTSGSLTGSPITETPSLVYDVLLDPLANYYTDITTSSDPVTTGGITPYVAGTAYNFAISALSQAPGGGQPESALSNTVSITPLGPLTLNVPTAGTSVTTPVTLSWTPVTGATKYFVFVYTAYPSINSVASVTPAPTGAASVSLPLSGGGVTYYVVVVGTNDQTETAGSTTPVTDAAQTYSEITKFTVQ